MADRRLRDLERQAASGDPEAVRDLRRAQVRFGVLSVRKWLMVRLDDVDHVLLAVVRQRTDDDGRVRVSKPRDARPLCRAGTVTVREVVGTDIYGGPAVHGPHDDGWPVYGVPTQTPTLDLTAFLGQPIRSGALVRAKRTTVRDRHGRWQKWELTCPARWVDIPVHEHPICKKCIERLGKLDDNEDQWGKLWLGQVALGELVRIRYPT